MSIDKYTLCIIGLILIAVVCSYQSQWNIVSFCAGTFAGVLLPNKLSSSGDSNAAESVTTDEQ